MSQIALEGMEFFAYHGHFDEEQKIGNKYSIDVMVDLDLDKPANTDNLKDTLNYSIIYDIVKNVMQKKHRLLEHVGHDIISEFKSKFSDIHKVSVIVSKFNPPIGGVCHRAKVTIEETIKH